MASELHYTGPISDIPRVTKSLSDLQCKKKIVKRNGVANLFITDVVNISLEHDPINLGSEWEICGGCASCKSKPTAKPKFKYTLYPPLVLLPTGTQISKIEAEELLAKFNNCTHVAINASISENDRVRRPQLLPVLGDFGEFHSEPIPTKQWLRDAFYATCTQNGIFQTWAPLYTMFSRGNITEKRRILTDFALEAPITNKTIVDLYVGIGYFTFSYAQQRPKRIYCWEINHWSVEGLVRAASKNNFPVRVVQDGEKYLPANDDFLVVFLEDNQKGLQRIDSLNLEDLSHINMGLLPDARAAFNVAHELATHSKIYTVVHVHENVRTVEVQNWKSSMETEFGECLKIERIKEYSPGVQHLCGDFVVK